MLYAAIDIHKHAFQAAVLDPELARRRARVRHPGRASAPPPAALSRRRGSLARNRSSLL